MKFDIVVANPPSLSTNGDRRTPKKAPFHRYHREELTIVRALRDATEQLRRGLMQRLLIGKLRVKV
jgi:hypothetical protein